MLNTFCLVGVAEDQRFYNKAENDAVLCLHLKLQGVSQCVYMHSSTFGFLQLEQGD